MVETNVSIVGFTGREKGRSSRPAPEKNYNFIIGNRHFLINFD